MTIREALLVAALVAGAVLVPTSFIEADSDAGEPVTDFHREWVWSTYATWTGTTGIELGDIDGDGRIEIVTTSEASLDTEESLGRWHISRYDAGFRQRWSSLPAERGIRRIRLAPAADSMDVVVVSATGAEIFDGKSKRLIRTIDTNANDILDARIADFDGLGGLEIAFCDSKALFVHDYATGDEIAAKYGFSCTDLAIGQVDSDAALELALAGNSLGGFVLDGATLSVQWALLSGFGELVLMVDVDHDGLDEVITQSPNGQLLRALDPGSGASLWEEASNNLGSLESADLDGDGFAEILTGDAQASFNQGLVRAVEESSGAPLWFVAAPPMAIAAIAAGHLDSDGALDLVWSGAEFFNYDRSNLHLADVETRALLDSTSGLSNPGIGLPALDLDGDGARDFVLAGTSMTETGDFELQVHLARPSDRTTEMVAPPVEADDYCCQSIRAVVAQLDQDPQLEICSTFAAPNSAGTIRCIDPSEDTVQWQLQLPEFGLAKSMLVAELDGDPEPELLLSTSHPAVFAFDGSTGWLKWRTPTIEEYGSFPTIRVGDVVGDSAPEVVAGGSHWTGDAFGVFNSATGQLAVPLPANPFLAGRSFDLAQRDADPQLEILCGSHNGDVRVFDPVSGQVGPVVVDYDEAIYAIRVGDVSRDGTDDLVVAVPSGLKIWSGANQQTVWESSYLGQEVGTGDGLWIGNFDSDTIPEILVRTNSGFAMFESPHFAIFDDGFQSGDTGAWSSTTN